MRYAVALLIILSAGLALSGCEGKGGYKDVALIAKAERALTRIRNSLEEYYLDQKGYPGENANLREALGPYFFRIVFYEGEEVARHFVTITDARNRLIQVRDNLREYQTNMEMALTDSAEIARFREVLEDIQQTVSLYELELERPKSGASPQYPGRSFERLNEMAKGLGLDERRESLERSLVAVGDELISMLKRQRKALEESVEDSTRMGEIWPHIKRADSLWLRYKDEWREKKVLPFGFPPAVEMATIKGLLPEGDTVFASVESLAVRRARVEQQGKAVSSFQGVQWKVERASTVLEGYDKKLRDRAKKASVIVKAQQALKEMAEVIEAYRVQTGAYPRAVRNLGGFFEEEYVQAMPEGTAKPAYSLEHLVGPPAYSSSDPIVNFRLDAQVSDEDRTPVFCDVKKVNEWDEAVATFSEYPVYATIDSTITYFVKVRANDSNRTPLSARPAVVREPEEKKEKKAKKGKRK